MFLRCWTPEISHESSLRFKFSSHLGVCKSHDTIKRFVKYISICYHTNSLIFYFDGFVFLVSNTNVVMTKNTLELARSKLDCTCEVGMLISGWIIGIKESVFLTNIRLCLQLEYRWNPRICWTCIKYCSKLLRRVTDFKFTNIAEIIIISKLHSNLVFFISMFIHFFKWIAQLLPNTFEWSELD